jgi:hypothetical protein
MANPSLYYMYRSPVTKHPRPYFLLVVWACPKNSESGFGICYLLLRFHHLKWNSPSRFSNRRLVSGKKLNCEWRSWFVYVMHRLCRSSACVGMCQTKKLRLVLLHMYTTSRACLTSFYSTGIMEHEFVLRHSEGGAIINYPCTYPHGLSQLDF